MANKIELARGDLGTKIAAGFGQAELFWEARTTDADNKSSEFNKWSEGTLWIGKPSLNGYDSKELPIPIAGFRANQALVFRGELSTQACILDETFKHARVGDFYIFNQDAVATGTDTTLYTFHLVDDFRKDDILVITDVGGRDNINLGTGSILNQSKISYYRVNNSGGYADDMYFRESVTKNFYQWQANNVEGALKETQIEKLQYITEIGKASDIPTKPIVGGLYLVTADDISFNTTRSDNTGFTCDKGDFVYYTADTLYEDDSVEYKTYNEDYYWHRIPAGYTNADEIDYYDADRINNGQKATFIASLYDTFSEFHKNGFSAAAGDVHSMLDFLMGHKAQLDEQGKIPLSQLHDTVLGALQYKGNYNPVNGTVPEEFIHTDEGTGLITFTDSNYYNPLPGYAYYADGDTLDTSDEAAVQNGDYYIIDLSGTGITNLQYNTGTEIWELNTGDWIVYSASDNQDSSSAGSTAQKGHWTKIDNTDRLSGLSYIIDRSYKDNFWTTVLDEKQLTLVGNPILRASHKIGLVNKGNNTVEIVGDHLVDQLLNEHSITTYYPRYANEDGTIENSFLQDIINEDGLDYIHNAQTTNKSIFHANVYIGEEDQEHRDLEVSGDIRIVPHLTIGEDGSTAVEKSVAQFKVYSDGKARNIRVFAADGGNSYGIEEDVADEVVNLVLPEHTSTLIGKLAGIEFEEGRLLKSVSEGYVESTSIEEHNNNTNNTGNAHDGVSNVVEFHSQVSTPIENTYEVWFGSYDTTGAKNYDDSNFNANGSLNSALLARLTKNKFQVEDNIYVMLPIESGTLITQEQIIAIFGNNDDTYLAMFGDTKTLDNGKLEFNKLQKSPIRQVENALRVRILNALTSNASKSNLETSLNKDNADEFTTAKGDGKYTPTTNVANADTVIENDLVVGEFDDNGKLKKGKSIFATKSIGIGDDESVAAFLRPARTNFPTASQYFDPYTGEALDVQDVQVDMPAESGVMLTSNSTVDGGLYSE